jgi:hypothetical protein
MADTTYIVLQQHTEAGSPVTLWSVQDASVPASSPAAAIRATADDNGVYVAVPARSWKPVTVTTETRTILKLEQPDPAA